MKPKRIQYYDTYETTLLKAQRYINAVCTKMNQEEHYNDMQNVGREGLWMAHTRFNPDDGREFHPYAITYIRTYIMNYLTNNARTIRVPAQRQREEDYDENKFISTALIDDVGTMTTVGDTLSEEEIDSTKDDEQELIAARLRHYFALLKPKQQRLLTMRYIEEKTLQEIADEYGDTRENIRITILKAINRLQKELGAEIRNPEKLKLFRPRKIKP